MDQDRLRAAVSHRPDGTHWSATLEFLLPAYTLGELDELGERIKSPQVFDHFLGKNLEDAATVATFLRSLGRSAQNDRLAALGELAQGDLATHRGRLEPAMVHFQEAAKLFEGVNDRVGQARTRIGWLAAAMNAGKCKLEELERLEEDCQVFKEAGQAYRLALLENHLGLAYGYFGQLEKAQALFERALDHCPESTEPDQRLRAWVLGNLAKLLRETGDIRRARALHEEALTIFIQLDSPADVANEFFNLCSLECQRGDYQAALHAAEEVRRYSLQARQPLGAVAAALARAEIRLRLNRPKEALGELEEATALLTPDEDLLIDRVKLLTMQAYAFAKCHNPKEVSPYLVQAETLAKTTDYPQLILLAASEHVRWLLEQNRPGEARAVALAGLDTAPLRAATISSDLLTLLAAEAALAGGQLDEAREEAQQVVDRHQDKLPEAVCRAHTLLAEIAARKGDLPRASQEYEAAMALLERVVQPLVEDQRADFLTDKDAIFLGALAVALKSGRPEQALLALERGRAYADWMAPHAEGSGQDPHLAELMQQLRTSNGSHTDAPGTRDLTRSVWQIRNYREAQSRWQPLVYPKADALLQAAPSGVTTVAYALLETDLVIFILREGTLQVRRMPKYAPEIRNEAANMHDFDIPRFLYNLNPPRDSSPVQQPVPVWRLIERFQQGLKRLWMWLIEPVKDLLPPPGGTLRLVPHGPLHALPLAALYDGHRYLIEQWALQVAPSCFQPPRQEPPVPSTRAPLVLGYAPGEELRWVAEEAKHIGRLLQIQEWTAEHATNARLQDEAPGRPYLHIAAHGEHRLDLPQASYVELADGPCFPLDILSLDLRGCRLVTLSACETGLGTPRGGDAQLGLVRAFRQAGAEAVLATLWKVKDAVTYIFMDTFYGHLVAGVPPVTALRSTQLAILHKRAGTLLAHPYFWAGYQLTSFITD